MTIENPALWDARQAVKDCAENTLLGEYEFADPIDDCVDECIEAVMRLVKEFGFQAAGDDRAANLEAQIYGYLKASNPETNIFILAESKGEAR